ncbi:hypothetical protein [Nocardioides marmorisolisilvae]|uniref:Uncharacterized protein n=1 Tax=Nocardioides marmorisolisilvae TaxID=1542737 RepID=A0A3N0DNU8_9ACTN|nr:hypothetical protein [Nocardioides marmorisolisilvae]RNL77324.1 hypothetical protein EFL95_17890 [Nocardioides marmorisolisilvae]
MRRPEPVEGADDDLRDLLGLAAGDARYPVDPGADLARARTAQRDRFRRRVRLGTGALALVAVAGVGTGIAISDAGQDDPGSSSAAVGRVRLVAEQLDATPYTFDLTPKGWSVQSQNADRVTIAPDGGGTSSNPDVFIGKLVILFDQNPVGGVRFEQDGRTFWLGSDSGYTTISTLTRGAEPVGVVRIQYPNNAGWTRATMVRFLASVHVGPGARPGLG